ncbi:MAG: hypothetical protein O3C23_02355 [bacterium]|nr:hypothetical protein [bacterium]
MGTQLHLLALSIAGAIVAAALMLLLGILGNMGLYLGAVETMQEWHMFFDLSIGGIIAGMIEGAIITFVVIYAFVWLYEKLLLKLSR